MKAEALLLIFCFLFIVFFLSLNKTFGTVEIDFTFHSLGKTEIVQFDLSSTEEQQRQLDKLGIQAFPVVCAC
ncbi:MAG: hypothetical protein LBH25_06145 [Fibromonadaceae bacterium]|jgi:hypothetical protein|nr:hypothetical protein [Fibromonadaceae bacterium]